MADLTHEDEDELRAIRHDLIVCFSANYGTGPTSRRFRAIWLTPEQAADGVIQVLRGRYAAAQEATGRAHP